MNYVMLLLQRIARRSDAQDLLEYAMLAALISIFAVGAVTTLGNTINDTFWEVIAASNV